MLYKVRPASVCTMLHFVDVLWRVGKQPIYTSYYLVGTKGPGIVVDASVYRTLYSDGVIAASLIEFASRLLLSVADLGQDQRTSVKGLSLRAHRKTRLPLDVVESSKGSRGRTCPYGKMTIHGDRHILRERQELLAPGAYIRTVLLHNR